VKSEHRMSGEIMSNRLFTFFLGVLINIVGGTGAFASVPSAVSINLCSDQLLLLLADPSQIKALSSLSGDPAGSYYHTDASRYPTVDALAEDILPISPDVVLTGPYAPRNTVSLLTDLGLTVQSLEIANSIDAMIRNIELAGSVLQQEARAQKITAKLRDRLASIELQSVALDQRDQQRGLARPRSAVYDANGYTVGANTLRGEAMKLAGWHNVASEKGIEAYGVLSLEDLIIMSPDAIVESPYSPNTYSRAQQLSSHPAIRYSGLNPVIIALPSNTTICAGPWSVTNVEILLEARAKLR